ncbi:MAG: hypothetical protein JKY90_10045 [Gammaproteobacteria bacterium]|nr:hypothetical protein [Gammaproteobacteria bacterium]
MIKKYFVYLLLGFLCACSDNEGVSKDTTDKATVFDSQIKALEKAKSVDQQVQDAATMSRQSIENSGG